MKSCFMTGNRDAPAVVYPAILSAVRKLVAEQGITLFITGGRGRFEQMAAAAVREVRNEDARVRLCLLLAYHPAQHPVRLPQGYDESLYPLETPVPPRIAIACVNRWMIDHCAACILYAALPGNSRKIRDRALVRARKGELLFVDLSES